MWGLDLFIGWRSIIFGVGQSRLLFSGVGIITLEGGLGFLFMRGGWVLPSHIMVWSSTSIKLEIFLWAFVGWDIYIQARVCVDVSI